MADPWFKFFPTDWRSDPKLRMCGLAARGLWIEMLALMHEATPYGHLLVSGLAPTDAQLAVLVGTSPDQIPALCGELESAGVFSRTKEGVIYSRRMTRVAKKSAIARKNGKNGGNPTLRKQKEISASDNQNSTEGVKPQKPEAIFQTASQLGAGTFLYDRLIEAASSRGQCHQNLAMGIGPITDLVAKGFDVDSDILPIVRERASPTIRSWSYFVTIIVQRHAERQAIPSKPAPKPADWSARVRAFEEDGTWAMSWGPRPGDPGCLVPDEITGAAA
ncbi:hypothetical protein ACFOOL_14990 [Devosia honganensis]|uniref:DUF1376 domain-containing protein n=1 Tax=Devosia honganensis TaxID=1610527 RepID=A0ABV7X4B6_9HYPH